MAMMQLSSPWAIRVREIEELFKYDPQVHVIYDVDESEVTIYVENNEKAYWLSVLLPEVYVFGNVNLHVKVVPSNGEEYTPDNLPIDTIYNKAFSGNGAFSFVISIPTCTQQTFTYVVFQKRVVQYFNDNLTDLFGHCSTLYETIAHNVLGDKDGVFYCTDNEDPVTFRSECYFNI